MVGRSLGWALLVLFLVPPSSCQQCDVLLKGHSDEVATYRVGVLANRGIETAYNEYNLTFADYLTSTAGQDFDPPVQFEVEAVPFGLGDNDPLVAFGSTRFDFIFANPNVLSCTQSEAGAIPLAGVVSRRKVGDSVYSLSQFGGVIFVSSGNEAIKAVSDIKDRSVGAISLSGLGSGQMQFREMQKAGLHHLQDPSQIIFFETQGKIVSAVLEGQVEVGFVRTDQLERYIDPSTDQELDPSRVKIIGKYEGLESDGNQFPFSSSTPLYPEWHLATKPHVDAAIVRSVQTHLLAIREHASPALALRDCYSASTPNCEQDAACRDLCFQSLSGGLVKNCDTTPLVSTLAHDAMARGKHFGFRTALPLMELRNMQEETSFLVSEPSVQCTRSGVASDSVVCPEGHFKRSAQQIENGCEEQGIPCYGFKCLCKPCVQAFDVDFYIQQDQEQSVENLKPGACKKFDVCGSAPQSRTIQLRALDNKKRLNATVAVVLHMNDGTVEHPMNWLGNAVSQDDKHLYGFSFDSTALPTGYIIIEILVNDEQISQSPFRFRIDQRDCPLDTGDSRRVASVQGDCECKRNHIELNGKCIPSIVAISCVLLPLLFILVVVVYFVVDRKQRKQADSVWQVKPEELSYSDPPRLLGEGTFGLVLLAEYRGTNVAVKRVLPPRDEFSCRVADDGHQSVEALPLSVVEKGWKTRRAESDDKFLPSTATGDDTSMDQQSLEFQTGWQFVLKSSKSNNYKSSTRQSQQYSRLKRSFIDEMRMLSKLRHPCITTIMGAVVDPKVEPMLVLEHMELGSLYDLLHNETMALEGDMLLSFIRDTAKGLRFLHTSDNTIVHCDLKAQNVLVDSKLKAKLSDFGLSMKKSFFGSSVSGTPFWMAPELLRGETGNSTESDIYAFGMVLSEIFTRKDPYEGLGTPNEILAQVADDLVQLRPTVPDSCPTEFSRLMKECMHAKPGSRPSAEEVDQRLQNIGESAVDSAMKAMQGDHVRKSRSDEILWELFPRHVASALKEGRKVDPETFPEVTLFFSDVVGFTNIAGSLTPSKVSSLLDRFYTKIDRLCDKHEVFKVETIGDAYVAVTNLASYQQDDHAIRMIHFSLDCIEEASKTLIDEDDPNRGCLELRVGLHSGPVVAHVAGTRTPKYSLFGDSVNIAARMESSSEAGRVHCSDVTKKILAKQAPTRKLVCRGQVNIKGKGPMITYFVSTKQSARQKTNDPNAVVDSDEEARRRNLLQKRLVDWFVTTLQELLRNIPQQNRAPGFNQNAWGVTNNDWVNSCSDTIDFPDKGNSGTEDSPPLKNEVVDQLKEFISAVANMYNSANCFHNFEHASQVALQVCRIIQHATTSADGSNASALTSDPLTKFAVVFAALAQGIDHQGVPNEQLVKEETDAAKLFQGESVMQQNALSKLWAMFSSSKYDVLCCRICQTDDDVKLFRDVVSHAVLATDVANESRQKVRQQRWDKAFSSQQEESDPKSLNNLKSTLIIEYASQVAYFCHMMLEWTVYRKWSERQFLQVHKAHMDGRSVKSPAEVWYKEELKTFDSIVLPLANKVDQCGMLGQNRDLLENVAKNRSKWVALGTMIVKMITPKGV